MSALRFAAILAVTLLGPATAGPVQSMLEIRQRNAVIQKWDVSCGAATLANILRYQHGLDVTERDVALGLIARGEYLANPDLVKIREGFSLLDMKRYAATFGLQGVGYAGLEFKDLIENAPVITTVDNDGYRHFVIFRGVAGNRVLLIDPNFGNVTMLREDFESIWQGTEDLGRVGFVVKKPGETVSEPSRLIPQLTDYWFFG